MLIYNFPLCARRELANNHDLGEPNQPLPEVPLSMASGGAPQPGDTSDGGPREWPVWTQD